MQFFDVAVGQAGALYQRTATAITSRGSGNHRGADEPARSDHLISRHARGTDRPRNRPIRAAPGAGAPGVDDAAGGISVVAPHYVVATGIDRG